MSIKVMLIHNNNLLCASRGEGDVEADNKEYIEYINKYYMQYDFNAKIAILDMQMCEECKFKWLMSRAP